MMPLALTVVEAYLQRYVLTGGSGRVDTLLMLAWLSRRE
jgi:hypothetical protein